MDTEGIAAKPIYSALITLVIIFALAVMILQPEVFVKQSWQCDQDLTNSLEYLLL